MSDDRDPVVPLIQISGGTWVDPRLVREVSAIEASELDFSEDAEDPLPDRVLIEKWDGTGIFVPCESFEEAEALRDELAGQFNEMRTMGIPGTD